MRASVDRSFLLLFAFVALAVLCAVLSRAQKAPVDRPHPELALDYTFLRSNAPPGACRCFNLSGGSVNAAFPLGASRWRLTADATFAHTGSVANSGKSLTLNSYTVGPRYMLPNGRFPIHPFLQTLVGVAHAGGAISQRQNATVMGNGIVIAANLGGGIDLNAGHRFGFRLLEVEDSITAFNNSVNNYQNILRVSSGVVFRFGR